MRIRLSMIAFLAVLAVAYMGCATRPSSEARLASNGPASVSPKETPKAVPADEANATPQKPRTPWAYRHMNHRHTFPWYKGQKPIFPVENPDE